MFAQLLNQLAQYMFSIFDVHRIILVLKLISLISFESTQFTAIACSAVLQGDSCKWLVLCMTADLCSCACRLKKVAW